MVMKLIFEDQENMDQFPTPFSDIKTGFTPTETADGSFKDYSCLENVSTPTPLKCPDYWAYAAQIDDFAEENPSTLPEAQIPTTNDNLLVSHVKQEEPNQPYEPISMEKQYNPDFYLMMPPGRSSMPNDPQPSYVQPTSSGLIQVSVTVPFGLYPVDGSQMLQQQQQQQQQQHRHLQQHHQQPKPHQHLHSKPHPHSHGQLAPHQQQHHHSHQPENITNVYTPLHTDDIGARFSGPCAHFPSRSIDLPERTSRPFSIPHTMHENPHSVWHSSPMASSTSVPSAFEMKHEHKSYSEHQSNSPILTPSTSHVDALTMPNSSTSRKQFSMKEKQFVCNIGPCEKRFARVDELKRHQRTHSDYRPYCCDTCNKGFTRSDHLITHRRTHTGEKPYACNFCDRCFARSDERSRHIKTHTNPRPPVGRGRRPTGRTITRTLPTHTHRSVNDQDESQYGPGSGAAGSSGVSYSSSSMF